MIKANNISTTRFHYKLLSSSDYPKFGLTNEAITIRSSNKTKVTWRNNSANSTAQKKKKIFIQMKNMTYI